MSRITRDELAIDRLKAERRDKRRADHEAVKGENAQLRAELAELKAAAARPDFAPDATAHNPIRVTVTPTGEPTPHQAALDRLAASGRKSDPFRIA